MTLKGFTELGDRMTDTSVNSMLNKKKNIKIP